MSNVLRSFLLGLCLSVLPWAGAIGQPADSLLEGTFWRAQGLDVVLPGWTNQAQTPEGLFYAELDRTWTPSDSTTQYPGMVARHVFSYAAAYLMSGEEAHLQQAETALDFMIEHGWDEEHGGWYNAVTRSGEVVNENKDLFMQIYATTGLAMYWIATRDDRAHTYLRRSREFMKEHAWDEEHGGYVNSLNRDGSVASASKRFSPQLAPLSGYLLYLYPVTRNAEYLEEAERIMDLTLTHMQDDRGWILERFAADWTFLSDHSGNSHINVGHNLEVAWLLLRLYDLTGTNKYREEGLALTDKLLDQVFYQKTGAWPSHLKRTDPSQHRSTTTWWAQAYGNFLQLYAYHTTGEERYLEAFRKGAQYWNQNFVDEKYGGTMLRAHLDGGLADGGKAVRTKTSYHAMEHSLLAYLYLSLWKNQSSTTLHYQIDDPEGKRLHPLPIEVLKPRIQRAVINGTSQVPPDTVDGTLRLPEEGPSTITIDVSSPSSNR
jgi:mannobiose 2-epimerase